MDEYAYTLSFVVLVHLDTMPPSSLPATLRDLIIPAPRMGTSAGQASPPMSRPLLPSGDQPFKANRVGRRSPSPSRVQSARAQQYESMMSRVSQSSRPDVSTRGEMSSPPPRPSAPESRYSSYSIPRSAYQYARPSSPSQQHYSHNHRTESASYRPTWSSNGPPPNGYDTRSIPARAYGSSHPLIDREVSWSRSYSSQYNHSNHPYETKQPPYTAPLPIRPISPRHHYAPPDLSRRHSEMPPHTYAQSYAPQPQPPPAHSRPSTSYESVPPAGTDGKPGTKPGEPIERATKACNTCRDKKIRCYQQLESSRQGDSPPPPCKRCHDKGLECVWTEVQKKRGPLPGSTRPAAGITSGSTGTGNGNATGNGNGNGTGTSETGRQKRKRTVAGTYTPSIGDTALPSTKGAGQIKKKRKSEATGTVTKISPPTPIVPLPALPVLTRQSSDTALGRASGSGSGSGSGSSNRSSIGSVASVVSAVSAASAASAVIVTPADDRRVSYEFSRPAIHSVHPGHPASQVSTARSLSPKQDARLQQSTPLRAASFSSWSHHPRPESRQNPSSPPPLHGQRVFNGTKSPMKSQPIPNRSLFDAEYSVRPRLPLPSMRSLELGVHDPPTSNPGDRERSKPFGPVGRTLPPILPLASPTTTLAPLAPFDRRPSDSSGYWNFQREW